MLKKFGLGLAFISALMFGVCTVNTVLVGSVVAASHEEGKKVEIAQVPAVVKAAIEKETAGGTVKEIVKKEADGKVCYAVKYVKDGMEKQPNSQKKAKDDKCRPIASVFSISIYQLNPAISQ